MRKHVVALLSMLGLASSSTPAFAQVVKGAQPSDTKSESTVKKSKTAQEDAAGKNAEYLKLRKAGAEQNANRDVVNEKIGSQTAGKHIAGVKYEKKNAEANAITDGSSKKVLIGLSQPRKAGEKDAKIKLNKADAEQSAATSADGHKRAKVNPAFADGSVRTSAREGSVGKASATSGGGGAGKVAMHDIHVKGEKNAAELNAAQQAANKKAKKQVDQASPK